MATVAAALFSQMPSGVSSLCVTSPGKGRPLCSKGVSHCGTQTSGRSASRAALTPSEKICPALVRASAN
eukprot:1992390-Rhodomonas_salina.1